MAAWLQAPTAYCGAAPRPGELSWNADPLLLLTLAAVLILLWRWARPGSRLGWVLLALLLASPLCHLSVALFSARAGQHLAILLLAAPLIAHGLPRLVRPGLPVATALLALVLWGWQLPSAYALTFASHFGYWAMQLSLIGAALWFWSALLAEGARRPDLVALAGIVTAAHTGMLGALLTLAPRPLYAVHELTAAPWGLTALEDQQLGGLLMWVPGGLILAAVLAVAMAQALRASEAKS